MKRRGRYVDRITNLPDEIRILILSLLLTKRAIKTILLSKQWKHIFPSLQVLRFDQLLKKKEDFNVFVDQVLRIYDNSKSIDEFILIADVDKSPITIDWLTWATSHHVRRLSVRNRLNKRCFNSFPISLFTLTSLTDLELKGVQIKFPAVTNTVFFPMLDRLRLKSVSFHQSINVFFSTPHCPRLRILMLRGCHLKTITIHSPTLSDLYISTSSPNPDINLSTPNLNQLRYKATEPPKISVESLSSLVYAEIILRSYETISQLNRLTELSSNLLRRLHKIIGLKISEFYPACLNRYPSWADSLPTTATLKYLELKYASKDRKQAIRLFKNFPELQTLHIYVVEHSIPLLNGSDSEEEAGESKELSDGDVFKCLNRVVEMKSFSATASELDIVTYLLENATILEKMKIRYNDDDSKMRIEEILFNVASPSAEILLYKSDYYK